MRSVWGKQITSLAAADGLEIHAAAGQTGEGARVWRCGASDHLVVTLFPCLILS